LESSVPGENARRTGDARFTDKPNRTGGKEEKGKEKQIDDGFDVTNDPRTISDRKQYVHVDTVRKYRGVSS